MSTEMHLARLGLLHLINNPAALKSALKEKAKSLRSNPQLRPYNISSQFITKYSSIKPPNKPTESE